MKRSIIICIISLLYFSGLYSQPWMSYIESKNQTPSYFEMEKAFNEYLSTNPDNVQRSTKKFKRWQYFWANRINEDGHFPSNLYWQEAKKVAQMSSRSRAYSNWTELGPRTIPENIQYDRPGGIGRIDCITFHPSNDSIYWIGTPAGGLWKTINDGETWENLTDNLPTLGVSDLVVHPNDENTLFLATGTRDTWWETFSVGILKSTDGGYTWNETGLSMDVQYGYQVSEILINPENPDIMIASTSIGIYRSEDGSDTWDRISYQWTKDIAFKPGDYNVIYASTFNPNGNASFFKSINGGLSFEIVQNVGFNSSQVNRICISVSEAAPDYVYLLCSSTQNNMYGFYKSIDGGDSWTEPIADPLLNLIGYNVDGHDSGGFGFYMIGFTVSPQNENEIYAGGANIWKSTDGGITWQNSGDWLGRSGIDYVHADQHVLKFNPLNLALYSGCDGGVYKLEPGSDDWQDRSEGLGILQIYRIGLFYDDDNRAIVGPQDNGIITINDTIISELFLAEAGDNFYDQTYPDKIFVSGYGLGLCKSVNGGTSLYSIQPAGETKLVFNPPYIMHPVEDIIYCAYSDVYMSENRGVSWTKIMDNPSSLPRMLSMEVSASNSNVLYTANNNNIWRTLDRGEIWTDITNGIHLGSAVISDITISDSNPLDVWITLGGYQNTKKVYSSKDGGDTWVNISYNLPNIPVNCITFEPESNSSVYIGTDVAVYYHNEYLSEWIYFSDSLPNVIINELEINPVFKKIKAGTFGRGIWESNLMDSHFVKIPENNNFDFNIYPNPTNGLLNIELKEKPETDIEISLFEISGKMVWNDIVPQPENTFNIQLPSGCNGNYLIKISYNNQDCTKQVTITK
jgi:photosystem II stability/assembly factor-like uncharacterized protein